MLYDKDYIDTFCKIDEEKGIKIKSIDVKNRVIELILNLYDSTKDIGSPNVTILYPLAYSVFCEESEDTEEMEWYEDFYVVFDNAPRLLLDNEEYRALLYTETEDLYPSNDYKITVGSDGKMVYDRIPA